MDKINIENLDLIITNKCNLNCEHCNRGQKGDTHMSKKIINASFNQINKINTLIIDGGEPSIALLPLYHLYDYLRNNKVSIENLVTIINGTVYSYDFLDILIKYWYASGSSSLSLLIGIGVLTTATSSK